MGMAAHQRLQAWQLARQLALACRKAAKQFPPEEHRLADQLRRAADSIVLNIAEGSARGSNREFRKFLEVARGSMKEVEAALALACDGELVAESEASAILALADRTARTLYGLLRAVNDRIDRGEDERRFRSGKLAPSPPPPDT